MKPRILLVHPPIYDFSAYDFWLKPHGMLRVAGFFRPQAEFALFDYLNRRDPLLPPGEAEVNRPKGLSHQLNHGLCGAGTEERLQVQELSY